MSNGQIPNTPIKSKGQGDPSLYLLNSKVDSVTPDPDSNNLTVVATFTNPSFEFTSSDSFIFTPGMSLDVFATLTPAGEKVTIVPIRIDERREREVNRKTFVTRLRE